MIGIDRESVTVLTEFDWIHWIFVHNISLVITECGPPHKVCQHLSKERRFPLMIEAMITINIIGSLLLVITINGNYCIVSRLPQLHVCASTTVTAIVYESVPNMIHCTTQPTLVELLHATFLKWEIGCQRTMGHFPRYVAYPVCGKTRIKTPLIPLLLSLFIF